MDSDGFHELWTHRLALAAILLATLILVACLARRLFRGRNRDSENELEVRAWSYCPKCGWPRGVQDKLDQAIETCLPSALLRRGWCREPALDAEGRIVLPGDSAAVAWSLWGAVNHSIEPGSSQWRTCVDLLDRTLRTRYGDTMRGRPMTALRWNRDPSRTKTEVVGVMLYVESMMRLTPTGPPPRI